MTKMRLLTICFFGLFIAGSCSQNSNIDADEIDDIKLIQVSHPYIGSAIDSIKLDKKLIVDFLSDFKDKREEVYKFYSCYVIKIHLKDGQFISYRTDGQLFEKFKDDNTEGVYFKLNKDINLLTKYWGLQPEQFCKNN
jgi:hypothetical protein